MCAIIANEGIFASGQFSRPSSNPDLAPDDFHVLRPETLAGQRFHDDNEATYCIPGSIILR